MMDAKNTIFRKIYIYIFAIGLIANAQALFFHADETDSIRAYGSTQAQITSGRFIGHYLDLLFEQMGFYFPFRYINVLLYIAFTAMAVMFILCIFDIRDWLRGCLIGGVIATSAVNSGVLVYYYVAHMYGLSFLISMISAYLIVKKKMMIIPSLLLVFSLGIYQAYFAPVILVIFLYQLMALADPKNDVRTWLLDVLRCVFATAAALLLYIWANKLALNLSGLSMSGYANMSENVVPNYGISQIIKLFITSYTLIFHFIFTSRYFFCDNVVIRLCIAISFISFLWFYRILCAKQKTFIRRCLFLGLFILLPCFINLPMFISSKVPERICLNWYFIFIIPVLLEKVTQTELYEDHGTVIAGIHRNLVPVMICAIVFASLYSAYRNINIYTSYAKANALAEDIVDDLEHRIAECDGFSPDKEICFIGALDTDLTNERFFNIEYSEFLCKLFNRDYSSIFKRYALLEYEYLTPDDQRVKKYSIDDIKDKNGIYEDEFFCIDGIHVGYPTIHSNAEKIKEMPSYPSYGCVQEYNGVVIIKLSD